VQVSDKLWEVWDIERVSFSCTILVLHKFDWLADTETTGLNKKKLIFRVVSLLFNLRQINRRLAEKANQVSDMDKTIRKVIRKLQARDVDLGLCNAELRRVQAELKVMRRHVV